jgi:hypothetical protein
VVAERVDSRRLQRIRDIPVAGAVEMMWATRRWFCIESRCARGTFAESTEQVPRFARSAQRLNEAVVSAVVDCGRAAAEVTRAHRVSWWLVQTALTATAAVVLPDVDDIPPPAWGVDEHRYRWVRFFRDGAGAWRRFEPWMTTLVDLATGQVLGVVDGRDSTAVGAWLASPSQAWLEGVEVVAIDPSASFRKGLREHLQATVSLRAPGLDARPWCRRRPGRGLMLWVGQVRESRNAVDGGEQLVGLLSRAGDRARFVLEAVPECPGVGGPAVGDHGGAGFGVGDQALVQRRGFGVGDDAHPGPPVVGRDRALLPGQR